MSILGFQVVLLDEQGQELERIPDVYPDFTSMVRGDWGYVHHSERDAIVDGQRVRYFKRLRPEFYCASCEKFFPRAVGLYPNGKGDFLHDADEEGSAACGPVLPWHGAPMKLLIPPKDS
jgi:hypothetical protein